MSSLIPSVHTFWCEHSYISQIHWGWGVGGKGTLQSGNIDGRNWNTKCYCCEIDLIYSILLECTQYTYILLNNWLQACDWKLWNCNTKCYCCEMTWYTVSYWIWLDRQYTEQLQACDWKQSIRRNAEASCNIISCCILGRYKYWSEVYMPA